MAEDFWDVVRRRAAEKASFDPRLTGPAPTVRPAVSGRPNPGFNPRPQLGGDSVGMRQPAPSRAPSRAPGLPDPKRIAALQAAISESRKSSDGPSVLSQAGGFANRVFSGVIDAIDTPGAAVRWGIAEGLERLPDSLKNADFQDNERGFVDAVRGDGWFWEKDANYGAGNLRFSDVSKTVGAFDENTFEGVPGGGLISGAVNFVGDIASDPITYGAGSTVRNTAAGGASVLDNALASGSRKGLATTVAEQAAKRGVADDAARQLIDAVPLVREAGQRGRGAFTRQGLKRAGYEADQGQELLKQLGLNSRFGYSFGYGKGRVAIPGTRRAAEAAENLKGAAKLGFSSNKVVSAGRRILNESDDAVISAEKQFINDIVTGADNSADAARGLVTIMKGREVAYPWMDAKSNDVIKKMGKQLEALSDEDAISIANMVETGQAAEGTLARQVQDWYQEVGAELQADGVEFGWVDNYINHRLTGKARQEVLKGRNLKLKEAGLDAAQPFQNTRQLRVEDSFLGERVPNPVEGQKYWTIDQINQVSERRLGYKLLEDDVRELMGFYLEQAGKAKLHREIYKATDEVGLNAAKETSDKITKQLAEYEAAAEEVLRTSQRFRREALGDAAQQAGRRKEQAAIQLEMIETDMKSRLARIDELNVRRAELNKELVDKQAQIKMWQDTVEASKRSKSTAKGNATRKIRRLEAEADEIYSKLQDTLAKLGRAEGKGEEVAALQARAEELRAVLRDATEEQQAAEMARAAMDAPDALAVPKDATAEQVQEAVEQSNRVAQVRQEFTEATDEYFDAAAAVVWQTTDDAAKRIRLESAMDRLESIENKATTPLSDVGSDSLEASRQELIHRSKIVHQALQDEGMEAAARAVRDAEAQAMVYDLNNWKHVVKAGDYKKQMFDALGNPKWQEHITEVLGDGFRAIDRNIAVPEWYDDAFKRIPKTQQEWSRLRRTIERYDAAMNVWKGWATTSPGFIFRNMYSGMFNMYLDDVSVGNVKRFQRFIHDYHQPLGHGPTKGRDYGLDYAKRKAAQRWGWAIDGPEMRQMEQALEAASVSGWGLTPQEVSAGLLDQKSWNPFSTQFRPTRAVRGQSTNVEGLLRGAHAYDKIVKGADVSEAVRRVEKFHFNYRDITDFDRMAKRVIPFWTFYSRNMVLQAEMWARYPQKLNRSYFNMKRNLEAQSEPDDVVPGYYDELGAVRTPFGDRNGGTVYFTPDLPSLRFRDDLASVTGTGGDGFDPLALLSSAGPAFKVPVEQIGNKRLFTGNEFNERLYEFTEDGDRVGRRANHLLQLPGIKHIADKAFGSQAEVVNGQLLMSDKGEAALEDIFPVIGRMNRLTPSTEKQKQRHMQNIASFMGVPGRVNTPNAIRGELYGRQKDAQKRASQERMDQILREITGG